jgi:urea transporter
VSTQLFAVVVVIGLALGALGAAWFAVAAARLSGEISQHDERVASANGDYSAATETEHDDG